MQSLHAKLRRAARPVVWAAGQELAREGRVALERSDADEALLRVAAPGFDVPPSVVLYLDPETPEWSCDCGGAVDPCPHVVAAATSLLEASRNGAALPAARTERVGVRYELGTRNGALTIARTLVLPDGRAEALAGPLPAALAASGSGATRTASDEDHRADAALESFVRAGGDPARIGPLFEALARCTDLRFDGASVTVSPEAIAPRARVFDEREGDAFVLRIERDPRVTDVVAAGVVRAGDALHPMAAAEISGARLEKLPWSRRVARRDAAELVHVLLPDLARKLAVHTAGSSVPAPDPTAKPRIHLEFDPSRHALSVIPQIVYGAGRAQARVEAGRLVYLGGGVPIRDEAAERRLLEQLRDGLDLVPGRRVDFDGEQAVRFAARVRAWAAAGGDDVAPQLATSRALAPRLQIDGDRFDLVFEVPPETLGESGSEPPGRHASADAVLRAFRAGLDMVPLEGGGWAPLPADWLARHGGRVADLLAARDERGAVAPAARPELARLCDELDAPRPASLAGLAPLLDGFEAIPHAALPPGFVAKLRPYQHRGADWLAFLRDAGLGGVLADDMGLGKTVQTLAALRGRTLVVCPTSVVHNWDDEIRRFRPSLRVAVHQGARRKLDPTADVTVTSYALLRQDSDDLAAVEWDAVVLDEAQAIKNPDSQTARAAYALRGTFRLALSGTPVENRLEELWSLFHFAARGLLGTRGDFTERYARPIADGSRDAAERLREKTRPFLLRRRKADVAPELPPRTDAVLHCELDERERAVYDAVRAATRDEVAALLGQGGSVLAALEALLRLRQAACHPSLVPGQHAARSAKTDRLLDALLEAAADGHKALVFSQWTGMLDLVEPHLRAAGVGFVRLDGSTRDRAAVVAEFQSDAGPPVMLVSLKAGGTGLNLTAADHVFLLDPWWNPATEDQAADRAHRIGQQRPVMVYRLVARDTVEERILALQTRKRALAEVAVGAGDAALAITRDDLLALLS